ncbi:cation diffusion facilitator family transporter [Donghicola tyrosinivorans]|uniref:Cobalt-zinc-cadmium efflux system protein n=1 Tax=Donghicola tyrosinivorans TaxID=1652492 RepID=A0A2T0WZM3_9RHOB|nr:cation diffusion facilitator family transporter [Donghicola tyrosinivorans]PRY92095.1 cobalt-zinc-cadmium efflux system protein [Donghicola tyrosinivorans]
MPHDHAHHGHHHHHHHVDPEAGDRQVAIAVGINMLLTVAQIIGGVFSGSIALIADAVHNFSDAISLMIAFFARKIARRPANAGMTFGYGRAEMVAALINYTTLIVISLYLAWEGIARMIDPPQIAGWTVVIVAGLALVIDLATALLTLRLSKESANIRAAFIHNLSDALGSLAVIVGGVLVILYDWRWVDPVITLLIAAYILWLAAKEIVPVIRDLMLATPAGLDANDLAGQISGLDGVDGVHHLHVWQMTEQKRAVQVHVVVAGADWPAVAQVRDRVRAMLTGQGFDHVTLEMEASEWACVDAPVIGH